ncbi:MAG: O-antigen ligase family protein, partial [Geminicoccales bacterium]
GSAWVVYAGLFVVTVPLVRYMRRSRLDPALRLLWLSMGVTTFFILLSQFYLAGLELIGKDPTLTNRTIIWEKAADFGWERPWYGAGYGTFWEGRAGRLWLLHGSAIGHAHNGFVDIWLQLGFIGAALMIAPMVVLGLRAVALLVKYRDAFSTFCGLIFAYVAAYSWVVKIIPDHRRVVWTVFVACILYAGVSLQALRKKKRLKARLEEMSASLTRGAASKGSGGAQA